MTHAPLVTPTIEQLRPYAAGKPIEELQRELGVKDVCKLASNENPLGPSPKALEAATWALAKIHRYPDAAAFYLRESLSTALSASHAVPVKPDEIVFGNGSNELLEVLVRTFTTSAQHVVFAEPSFVVYRMAALAHGVPFTAVPLKDYVHDLPAMAQAVQPQTRMVFVANPNNPTGTYVSEGALRRFLGELPESVIPVIDEAYFEYATAGDYADSLTLRALHPRLVVLRTFSKAYGLAGLRLGYAVCSAELADYMNRVRAPFNTNSVAQAAAIAALADQDHLERVVNINSEAREWMASALSELGLLVVPSQTNFLLVDLKTDASNVYAQLLKRGVITRPIPPLPSCLRISLGMPVENERLVAALKELL